MTDSTTARRQAALRERERAAGLIRRTVVIPEKRDSELKTIIAEWKKESEKREEP
jgi:hypothetical protein